MSVAIPAHLGTGPDLAVGGDGSALIAWDYAHGYTGTWQGMPAEARFRIGNGPLQPIPGFTDLEVLASRVAVGENGDMAISYVDKDYEPGLMTRQAGGEWIKRGPVPFHGTEEVTVTSTGETILMGNDWMACPPTGACRDIARPFQVRPAFRAPHATDGQGRTYVSWATGYVGGPTGRATVWLATRPPGGEFEVEPIAIRKRVRPVVELLANDRGDLMVAWLGERSKLFTKSRHTECGWSGAKELGPDIQAGSDVGFALADGGRATAVGLRTEDRAERRFAILGANLRRCRQAPAG